MFKDDFVWGVASSAYQIEGGDAEDERGKCIWDTFQEQGNISGNDSADIACDHYHRYKEDYALMRNLGIKAYRFSISWARIMPEGTGKVNAKAIAFYRDMILEMKKNGIVPYLTMYHWELPQALQDKGGWLNEEIIEWFADYAKVVAENFSDIVDYIITLNEPECFVGLGYLTGIQAPGLMLSIKETLLIAHNALRAHGRAVINLRKYAKKPIQVGYAPTCGVAYPYSDSAADIEAARKVYFSIPEDSNWTWNVAWFNDPVFLGSYPEEGLKRFKEYLPEITKEDMELISQPLDFMGQNIYNGYWIRAGENGEPEYVDRPAGFPKNACNWPVTPECLYWGVKFIYERYHMPIYITENGMDCHDDVSADGRVHDPNRIDFLDAYISQLQKASDEGCDVRGYFLWTFLDNFEWTHGYRERFGIVHVDFATQKRIAKDSAFWYQKTIETNGSELSINKQHPPILFLNPVFKEMIWGGDRLKTEFSYQTPSEHTGECWAVCAHPNGESTVSEGIYKGKTLAELWTKHPELFGNVDGERFPLLVKMIDAKEDLSIQVHPDNAYALKNERGSLGKTECWYVLDCKPDAKLVIGHHASTKTELRNMIETGRWKELMREVPVKKGDFIQIDPGTIHAIKGGMLVLETQQNSDITYRVYDYDRRTDGIPRELHKEKAIDVITVPAKPIEEAFIDVKRAELNKPNLLIANTYYKVWKLDVTEKAVFTQDNPFLICSVVEGDGMINGQLITKGTNFILPAGFGEIAMQGKMKLILSTIA